MRVNVALSAVGDDVFYHHYNSAGCEVTYCLASEMTSRFELRGSLVEPTDYNVEELSPQLVEGDWTLVEPRLLVDDTVLIGADMMSLIRSSWDTMAALTVLADCLVLMGTRPSV